MVDHEPLKNFQQVKVNIIAQFIVCEFDVPAGLDPILGFETSLGRSMAVVELGHQTLLLSICMVQHLRQINPSIAGE